MKNHLIREWIKLKAYYPETDGLSIPFVTSIGWLNRNFEHMGPWSAPMSGLWFLFKKNPFENQLILLLRTSML